MEIISSNSCQFLSNNKRTFIIFWDITWVIHGHYMFAPQAERNILLERNEQELEKILSWQYKIIISYCWIVFFLILSNFFLKKRCGTSIFTPVIFSIISANLFPYIPPTSSVQSHYLSIKFKPDVKKSQVIDYQRRRTRGGEKRRFSLREVPLFESKSTASWPEKRCFSSRRGTNVK